MVPTPADTDPAAWHRHFAAQANNRAWDLAENRTDATQDAQMLAAAHAAAWHWNEIGSPLERMRATMLLALVNALAGQGERAFSQAESVRDWFLPDGRTPRLGTPDWELAFVHAVHALAAHALGRAEQHATSWNRALQAIEAIADTQDREIVLKTWARVPAPGGSN